MTSPMRLLLATCFLFGSSTVQTTPTPPADSSPPQTNDTTRIESSLAVVDGIQMYYEVHGKPDGTPLVLLHGGGAARRSTRLSAG